MKFHFPTIFICIFILSLSIFGQAIAATTHNTKKPAKPDDDKDYYLSRPRGSFEVGFQDFHWVNSKLCPDPNYNDQDVANFSPDNKQHCHEIMARVYYPTFQHEPRSNYYPPFIKSLQKHFSETPGISQGALDQLSQLQSYAIAKAPVINNPKFPVLFFSPGFGVPAQIYENFIGELVSKGYIVVAINSLFINGDIELPNGHVVPTAEFQGVEDIVKRALPVQIQDLSYAFNEIQSQHKSNPIFSAMDLQHVGAFGHSLGAVTVADVSRSHLAWFQAIATLDIGSVDKPPIVKKNNVPSLYILSAKYLSKYWPYMADKFELEKNAYLVGIAKNDKDFQYSNHLDLSDFSTLRYLPASQATLDYDKQQGYNIKLMAHEPSTDEAKNLAKESFVLSKEKGQWNLFYYRNGNKLIAFDVKKIKSLESDLNKLHLPSKAQEPLSDKQTASLQKVMKNYFPYPLNVQYGIGNGWEINHSVRTYLVQFFNTFLTNNKNIAFYNCSILAKDSFMKCGPGVF